MPAILHKSNTNLSAADRLLVGAYKLPSAHLSYYSMFQRTKYILNHKLGFSYKEQDEVSKNKNSHTLLVKEFIQRLVALKVNDVNDLLVSLNSARMLRNKVDYKPQSVTEAQLKTQNQTAHEFVKNTSIF